jgi:hypothetical protein
MSAIAMFRQKLPGFPFADNAGAIARHLRVRLELSAKSQWRAKPS